MIKEIPSQSKSWKDGGAEDDGDVGDEGEEEEAENQDVPFPNC